MAWISKILSQFRQAVKILINFAEFLKISAKLFAKFRFGRKSIFTKWRTRPKNWKFCRFLAKIINFYQNFDQKCQNSDQFRQFGPSGCRTLVVPDKLPALASLFRETSIWALSGLSRTLGRDPKIVQNGQNRPWDQKSDLWPSNFDLAWPNFDPWDQNLTLGPQILPNWSKFWPLGRNFW